MLRRQLTLVPLFFLVVANMVGTGIFTTSGYILQDVQSPTSLVLCWVMGGVLAMAGAVCYGELGAMLPKAGGDYVFLRESFGKRIAFLSGWISLWVGFSAPIAASGIAFGHYFSQTLPSSYQIAETPVILAITVIMALTAIHLKSLTFGAKFQSIFSGLKVILILVLIGVGFLWGKGSMGHFAEDWKISSMMSMNFATSLIFVSFAYSGWNASTYLGSEVKDPQRNIPASIIRGTLFVMLMYVLLNIIFVYAIPPNEMQGVKEIGSLAATRLFNEQMGYYFTLAIAFFLLSSLSAMIMTGPRVYYAMACDKSFFGFFGNVDRTHHVPSYAIVLQATIAIAFVLTSTFYTILIYTGFVLSIFSSLTVAGMMYLRKKRPDLPRPYRTWGYPLTPILFIATNVWIVVFSLSRNYQAFFWGVATILAGWLVYEYFHQKDKIIQSEVRS